MINIVERLERLMGTSKVREFLAKIPAALVKSGTPMILKAGTVVLKKDERVEYAYLLLSGELIIINELSDGNFYSWSTLTACDFVSDLEVLSETMVSVADVSATEDCAVLRLPVAEFVFYLDTDMKFLRLVATCIAKKLYTSSYERGNDQYKKAVGRLALYLLRHYLPKEQERVSVHRTRQVIAGELGISIRTVNRSVSILKQQGYVSIQHGKITITQSQYGRMLERWDKSGEALNQYELWRKLS